MIISSGFCGLCKKNRTGLGKKSAAVRFQTPAKVAKPLLKAKPAAKRDGKVAWIARVFYL